MAGLDKGKRHIRPGLSSSTFIPPTLNSTYHAYRRLKEVSKTSLPLVLSNDLQVLSDSNLFPTSIYHQGRGTLSPRKLPRLCKPCGELEEGCAPSYPLSTPTDTMLPSPYTTANRHQSLSIIPNMTRRTNYTPGLWAT